MTVTPTPPIELTGTGAHLGSAPVAIPADVVDRLHSVCPTTVDLAARAEVSRDWWPLSMHWALAGQAPQVAAAGAVTEAEFIAIVRGAS